MISVNLENCGKIGGFLAKLKISDPISRVHGNTTEDKLFFSLVFVGICHSINYDFLSGVLAKVQREHPEKFNPKYMAGISDRELFDWLKDYQKQWRLKIETRAAFVRDMCKKLNEKYDGSVLRLLKESDFNIEKISKSLDLFDAYSEDPLRKKTSCFIMEVGRNNLAELSGWEHHQPQMDYHIARAVLRTGLVNLDGKSFSSLTNFEQASAEFAIEVRSACIKALLEVAKIARKRSDDVRLPFWYIGRECCHEQDPCCISCKKGDCTMPKEAVFFGREKCFFAPVCKAAEDTRFRLLREPNFETSYY